MPNVVVVPGTLGSALVDTLFSPFRSQRVWINPLELALGGLGRLQLGSSGRGPGPLAGGAQVVPDGPLVALYGPLAAYLGQNGYNAALFGYDWRGSLLDAANSLLSFLVDKFGRTPWNVVAHSLGGLVARAAWKLAGPLGLQSLFTRIVTLGTPQYGSFEINRVLGRLDLTYWYLAGVNAIPAGYYPKPAVAYVDQTITSWPGFFELLPFRRSGPLANNPDVGALLYTASNYSSYNNSVRQVWLDAADSTQQFLSDAIPSSGRLVAVVGYGELTPSGVSGDAPLTWPEGYEYTQNGDGQVELQYATIPGVNRLFVRSTHSLLPIQPAVWQALLQVLPNGLTSDWILN